MRGELEDMSWPSPPPVTAEEDEAWSELADRMADRIAERLADAPDDRPLLTAKDVAARLRLSERATRDLMAGENPRLPSVLVGPNKARRVRPADLDAYVEEARS